MKASTRSMNIAPSFLPRVALTSSEQSEGACPGCSPLIFLQKVYFQEERPAS